MKNAVQHYFLAPLIAGLLLCAAAPAIGQTRPANSLSELFANLKTCFGPMQAPEGAQLTMVFSLRRNGTLIGQPRISDAKLPKDPAERQRFLGSASAALAKCLPANITNALGGAIAGRPLAVTLILGREAALEPWFELAKPRKLSKGWGRLKI